MGSTRDYHRALEDCSTAIQRKPHYIRYLARAELHRKLGDCRRALDDLNTADALDHSRWLTAFGPHTRADTLARLGRLDEALADCDLIRADHWMPAHDGLPGGDKDEFIAEIRRRAAAARR